MDREPRAESPRRSTPAQLTAGILEAVATLAAVTAAGKLVRLNSTTVGFLFLVAVLIISSRRPLVIGTAAAVAATVCYNFFFFEPTFTFSINEPSNWVALVAFLVASLVANRLLVRERMQSERAESSRKEVETLYGVSVDVLRSVGGFEGMNDAIAGVARKLGAASCGLVRIGTSPQQQQVAVWTGSPLTDEVEDVVAGVARHRRFTEIPSRFGRDAYIPITTGGRVGAVLVVRGSTATRGALESLGTLLSLAFERERFVGERAHLEALRESNELKTALLRAVSHDLNSPLTVLSVEGEALQRKGAGHADAPAHVAVIREQTAQLQRRIQKLLSIARHEAGIVNPHSEPTDVADIFHAAREGLAAVLQSRAIHATVAPETPHVLVDPSLALEIVVNLVENANRASSAGKPIELSAAPSPESADLVWIDVLDSGEGFSAEQRRALRSIDFPDAERRGLGLEIARTLASLSGGSVVWLPRDGGGTIARLELPAARIGMATEIQP